MLKVVDNNGNKIKGFEPNAEKAIHHLNKIITSIHGSPGDTLKLAKIYHLGMHKFEPDLEMAEKYYTELKHYFEKSGKTDSKIYTEVIDGLKQAKSRTGQGKPVCVLMHTVMGNGVDFMMHTHAWHGKAPNDEQLATGLAQNPETLGDY